MTKKKRGSKRVKHIPHRTCVGCRKVESKYALVRIVRTAEGVAVDPTGKRAGRGAYLHLNQSCWENGLSGSLAKALKTTLEEKDILALKMYFRKTTLKSP